MYNCTAIRILNHHVVTELEENFPACTGFETALRIFSYMLPTKYHIQIKSKDTTPDMFWRLSYLYEFYTARLVGIINEYIHQK